jgi:hypothetical protein
MQLQGLLQELLILNQFAKPLAEPTAKIPKITSSSSRASATSLIVPSPPQ